MGSKVDEHSATRVRYAVIGVTTLMSLLLYLDRFCISVAESFIKEDLALTDWQVGWILGGFFWSYALAQVPSGWLTDRFGSRRMLTLYVLVWSFFTAMTGFATGFMVLLITRLGFGLAQAGAYPTGASIVSKWVPFAVRGSASGMIAFGGRVGGWLALLLTGYVVIWLTPAGTPVELSPRDILDSRKLCQGLVAQGTAESPVAAGSLVWQQLTAEQQAAVLHHGETEAAVEDGEEDWSASDRDELLAVLNRLIQTPNFFPETSVSGLSLEGEAKRLVRRENLTSIQSQRLNRFVLEALYSDGIRKLYGAGWRPMMWVFGSLGLVVALALWMVSRDRPDLHPWCNEAEVELIQDDPRMGAFGSSTKVGGVPLGRLLRSVSMWLVCLTQWCTNIGWVFIVTWSPRYFQTVHEVSVEERALLISIPPLIGWLGMLSGGTLTDYLVGKVGLRWGRALPMSLSRFVAMSAYLACLFEPNKYAAVALFSVVAFSTDIGTPSVWAFKQDVGGRYVGSILGWGNMWGNLGAAVTPPFLIWLVGTNQNWNLAFATCAGAFFVAGIAALGVNATVPIAPLDEKPA